MSGTNIKYGDFDFRASGLAIPTISINSDFNFTPGGDLIGETLNITLNGQIRDSGNRPLNDSKNFRKLDKTNWEGLTNLVSGIQKHFSIDYKKLEILCGTTNLINITDADADTTKVNSIKFTNNTNEYWLQIIDYSIDLQIERSNPNQYAGLTGIYVSNIENSYTINPNNDFVRYYPNPEQLTYSLFPSHSGGSPPNTGNVGDNYRLYTVTRRLGATGKATKNGALYNAKKCVTGLLSKDISFFNVLDNLTIYDRSTTIEADSVNGSYAIIDTFQAHKGTGLIRHTESFDINHSLDEKFLRTVTINGTIQGLKYLPTNNSQLYWNITDDNNPTTSGLFWQTDNHTNYAYINASGALLSLISGNIFYNRVLATVFPSGFIDNNAYRGRSFFSQTNTDIEFNNRRKWINPDPIVIDIRHNISEGSITYGITYNSRPLQLLPNSIVENIDISDNHGVRQQYLQTVFRRMPIPQDIGTYNLPTRSVQYDVSFAVTGIIPSGISREIRQNIVNIIQKFNPNKINNYVFSWITENNEKYNPIDGSFTKNITWAYEIHNPN
jgi:hypothetical protein